MKFSLETWRTCYQPKQRSRLRSIFQSFIGPWVKTRLSYKTTYSKSNPVQSSRSKLTTCMRKGRAQVLKSLWTMVLLVLKSLETFSGMILNWLQPKFAVNTRKWKAEFERRHAETCIDWRSFDVQFKDCFSNLLLEKIENNVLEAALRHRLSSTA